MVMLLDQTQNISEGQVQRVRRNDAHGVFFGVDMYLEKLQGKHGSAQVREDYSS